MIIYTRTCPACTHSQLWRNLKRYALEHGLSIEERRVTRNPAWAEEAKRYGVELPFVVNGNEVKKLNEVEGL